MNDAVSPRYRRILLKLSGQALGGDGQASLDATVLRLVAGSNLTTPGGTSSEIRTGKPANDSPAAPRTMLSVSIRRTASTGDHAGSGAGVPAGAMNISPPRSNEPM